MLELSLIEMFDIFGITMIMLSIWALIQGWEIQTIPSTIILVIITQIITLIIIMVLMMTLAATIQLCGLIIHFTRKETLMNLD